MPVRVLNLSILLLMFLLQAAIAIEPSRTCGIRKVTLLNLQYFMFMLTYVFLFSDIHWRCNNRNKPLQKAEDIWTEGIYVYIDSVALHI